MKERQRGNRTNLLTMVLLSLAAVLVLGNAQAQQVQGAPGSGQGSQLMGLGENVDSVPPAEMQRRAAAIVKRIGAVEEQVAAMLASAKDERNVVRVLCLTDKGNQVALALGTAQDRQTSMVAALSRGAGGRARHEFRLLIVVGQSVEQLSSEANVCLGGEAGPVGDSSLTVNIDPNLPAPDPGIVPLAPFVVVVPLVASPTD